MTCVVGLITDTGDVVLGADSLVTDDTGSKITLTDKKVFLKNSMIFGFCGYLRYGQLVKHRFNPPSPGRTKDTEAFIHTKFVPELQKFFVDCGHSKLEDSSFSLMVGINKALFTIGEDFSVIESPVRYCSIGDGSQYALGVMYATKTLKSETQRITMALEASSAFCQTVSKPFHFEKLPAPLKRRQATDKK